MDQVVTFSFGCVECHTFVHFHRRLSSSNRKDGSRMQHKWR
jgi:hypothetical protein